MSEISNKWLSESLSPDIITLTAIKDHFYSGRTVYQSVEILELGSLGRCLVLDGKTQSAEIDEHIYHEALVHPALLSHPDPKQVFIAGGGEGATLREVLAHNTVERVTMVDIDQELVELCQLYLPNHHKGAFKDARTNLHFQDAGVFLKENTDTYDLMVIDIPDPLEGGPAYHLFTLEFYTAMKKRLNANGLIVVQSGPTTLIHLKDSFTPIFRTMSNVFPEVCAYQTNVPSFSSMWGFVIGSLGPIPLNLGLEEVNKRIQERIPDPLRFYDGETHLNMFSLPKYLREGVSQETRIITEDNPLFVQ